MAATVKKQYIPFDILIVNKFCLWNMLNFYIKLIR